MARFNVIERRLERFLQEPASVRNAVGVIVVATILVVVGGGVLIRVLDPHEYADIWTGMWWSLQTVTTVGYGDIVPETTAGRFAGIAIMLTGIAVLGVLAGSLASLFHLDRADDDAEAVGDAPAQAPDPVHEQLAALGRDMQDMQARLAAIAARVRDERPGTADTPP